MNCKNCQSNLSDSDKYCNNCGAKVVKQRFSIKMLLEDATKEIFGWDNKYFVTVKNLIVRPEVLIQEYLNGTRKRYVNPIAFVTIGAALSVLFFNIFSKEYMAMATAFNNTDAESVGYQFGKEIGSALNDKKDKEEITEYSPSPVDSSLSIEADTGRVAVLDSPKKGASVGAKMNTIFQENILKYYNLFTYLILPIYALLAFWVFGKPYNYAEHLVIGCFLQGLGFLTGTLSFLCSVFIHPSFMSGGVVIAAIIYSYAYGRLYKHSIGQVIVKFLKFLLLLTAMVVVFSILFTIVVFISISLGYELPQV